MLCPRCETEMDKCEPKLWYCPCCDDFAHTNSKDTKIFYMDNDRRVENMDLSPSACSACGNPAFPYCKDSCSLFD